MNPVIEPKTIVSVAITTPRLGRPGPLFFAKKNSQMCGRAHIKITTPPSKIIQ